LAPEDVVDRVNNDIHSFLLDIRSTEDFERWRIPGSTNLPITSDLLNGDFSELAGFLDSIPDDSEVVVICANGDVSGLATEYLCENGFTAVTMKGGMDQWNNVHYSRRINEYVVQVDRMGTGCLSYIIHSDGEAVIVDPTLVIEKYKQIVDALDVEITSVIDTHTHTDHVSGAVELSEELDIPYYLHPDDRGFVSSSALVDGDVHTFGQCRIEVTHTPGHTPGSICLYINDELLITGDTLFLNGVGRPDLNGSVPSVQTAVESLFESLTHLQQYPDDTIICPGHYASAKISRPISGILDEVIESQSLITENSKIEFIDKVSSDLPEASSDYSHIKQVNRGEQEFSNDDDVDCYLNSYANR